MNRILPLLLLLVLALCCSQAAFAGCPIEAEKDAQTARKIERKLKALLPGGSDEGQEQVVLTEPGTVTTIAPGRGLEMPRPWSVKEKHNLDKARINKNLPAPKGVWQ